MNALKKRWTSSLKSFWSYWHWRMWFLEWQKAASSEHPFVINELTIWKHWWNVSRRCFYANFSWMSDKSITKRSLLARSEILGLCFNRLTCDHMYYNLSTEIFQQLVRTQLSQKPKTFSWIFIAFFKSLLVRSEVLWLCLNTLTGDHMYSHVKREIFLQLVWTHLSQKPKTFSPIFIAFFKST